MTTSWVEQAEAAYCRMAHEAHYRPAAPSDGFGNIIGPLGDLSAEARTYARRWREEEDARNYPIGCPDFHDRETLIFIIEAARLLCAVARVPAAELLRMALANLDENQPPAGVS